VIGQLHLYGTNLRNFIAIRFFSYRKWPRQSVNMVHVRNYRPDFY
jgi:hypothetical protein